jgi:hypothetical protein
MALYEQLTACYKSINFIAELIHFYCCVLAVTKYHSSSTDITHLCNFV